MCVDPKGQDGELLELAADMQCGVGDNSGMKRPLFNLTMLNYPATVLSCSGFWTSKDCVERLFVLASVCVDDDDDDDEDCGCDDNVPYGTKHT